MRFVLTGAASAAYTDQLSRAGVLLEAEGGQWLIEVSSAAEAVEWASRAPDGPAEIEPVAR